MHIKLIKAHAFYKVIIAWCYKINDFCTYATVNRCAIQYCTFFPYPAGRRTRVRFYQ